MYTLKDWLDRAPREVPVALHAARCLREGIYSRSRVAQELLDWARNPERLDELDEASLSLLERVALAGGRRVAMTELSQEKGADELTLISRFERLRDELWCAMERDDEGPSLAIFADHCQTVLQRRLERQASPEPPPPPPISWHWRFLQGMSGLCARLRLGKARTNRDGRINRRDQQGLEDSFEALLALGSQASVDAVRLGLSLLGEDGQLRSSSGRLDLANEAIGILEAFAPRCQRWWLGRYPEIAELLELWSDRWIEAQEAAMWFGAVPETKPPLWEGLPLSLRLAILCGVVEARFQDGHPLAVRNRRLPPPEADASRLTPDLKLLLPPGASLADWYRSHLLGVMESNELYTRFRLEREAWLGGISVAGSQEAWAWVESLQPTENVRQSLETWTQARTLCALRSITVLQVRDPRRQRELASLPQMAEFIREEIPGWGFVLDSSREGELRELLSRLGYEPPPLREEETAWTTVNRIPDLELPGEVKGSAAADPVWPKAEVSASAPPPATRTRFSGELRELSPAELAQLLDYAVVMDSPLEMTLKGAPKRLLKLWPERLDKRKSPVTLRARNSEGGLREIPLDSIRQLRLIEE
jgi:hypothetical protein